MKKIKYTPDAADKLRALKSAIFREYGEDKAKKIIKSITDTIRGLCDYEEKGHEVSKMFDVVSDYRYIFVSRNYGSITKLMGFRIPHIINSAHINEF